MVDEYVTDRVDGVDPHTSNNHGIFGSIRQAAGEPVAGARVTLADMAGHQVDVVGSDVDGRYRLTAVTGGTYLVIGAAGGFDPVVSLIAVGNRAVRHDITLTGNGGIVGTLRLSGSGQPVADAVIIVSDTQGNIVAVAHSNGNDGGFRIAHLAEGPYTLVVTTELHPPIAQTVEIHRGTTLQLTVELDSAGSITGIVVDLQDNPFPGARVLLLDERERVLTTDTTGPDGSFAFEGLPTGRYGLVANGYGPAAVPIHIADGQTHYADLTLVDVAQTPPSRHLP